MRTYLIKIYTKHFDTQFNIDSEEIFDVSQLHKKIVDYLGKNTIEWKPSSIGYTGSFYITYEEVKRGERHNVTLCEEDTARV